MRTGVLTLSMLLLSGHALADEDYFAYFRPRVILAGQFSASVSDTGYEFIGLKGAFDLRLGGFTMGAVLDFADGVELPLSFVSVEGRLGGYIYVNPRLALQPHVGMGYDWWYLTGSSLDEEGLDTVRASTGLRFIIRAAGRFLIIAGPEIRYHAADDGDVITFQATIGVGVGLGG